jgi:hypothetical protein
VVRAVLRKCDAAGASGLNGWTVPVRQTQAGGLVFQLATFEEDLVELMGIEPMTS